MLNLPFHQTGLRGLPMLVVSFLFLLAGIFQCYASSAELSFPLGCQDEAFQTEDVQKLLDDNEEILLSKANDTVIC